MTHIYNFVREVRLDEVRWAKARNVQWYETHYICIWYERSVSNIDDNNDYIRFACKLTCHMWYESQTSPKAKTTTTEAANSSKCDKKERNLNRCFRDFLQLKEIVRHFGASEGLGKGGSLKKHWVEKNLHTYTELNEQFENWNETNKTNKHNS